MKVVAGGLALASLLCWAPGSRAAVYTGSATDPSGDLTLEIGDGLPSPLVDFTGVAVTYNDVTGRVDVAYTLNRPPAGYQGINAGVGLGSVLPNGYCSTPQLHSLGWHLLDGEAAGQAAVWGDSMNFSGSVWGSVWNFNFDETTWQSTSFFEWPGFGQSWNFATANAALVGKHYTCARAAIYVGGGGAGGVGGDYLNSDVFALTPVTPASPSATWQSPKDGQTVSGTLSESGPGAQKCEVKVVGPVARTENYVDGRLNDTQVFHPWGCEWDTRNYVNGGHLLTVKAYDAANNVIAADTIRVTVNNPSPPLADSPPPPTTESRAPSGAGGGGTVTGSQPDQRLTRSEARRAAKRVLARRYGRTFRGRKGYTARCMRLRASSWRCSVRWRYGRFVYKGKVRLTVRSDGRVVSRTYLRKTTK